MFEVIMMVVGCGVMVGAVMTTADEAVDLDRIASDLHNDPSTLKADAEVATSLAVVQEYNEVVGDILRGTKTWSDGSSIVSTRLPQELDHRVLNAHAKLGEARRRAFDRVARPRCDVLLEDDRRRAEATWEAFTTAMATLDAHEKTIRAFRPNGALFRCETASQDHHTSDTALQVWRSRTWATPRTARPKLPRINERKWIDELVAR